MLESKLIKLLTVSLSICFSYHTNAQTGNYKIPDYKWSITAGVGISEYAGNFGVGFLDFDLVKHKIGINTDDPNRKNEPGIGFISINKYHNQIYDFSLRAYHGEWGYYNTNNNYHFHHKVSGIEFTPRWKFMHKINPSVFEPYLMYGIGFRRVQTSSLTPNFGLFGNDREGIYEINIPGGIGVNIIISGKFSINMQSNIAWTSNKNNSSIGSTTHNWLWNHTIGLTWAFSEKRSKNCFIF
ncbi:MAG: hypothetical protein Q8M15_04275 [Bacteroidota bacterium]|nr:hypothetical protein [Bacteroidota bacterium]